MTVLVHRESAGPEDGPRPRMFEIADDASLGDLLRLVAKSSYLPDLPGGRATWLFEGERPLAVATQEYREPWPLVALATPLSQVAGCLPRPHFRFRAFGKRSPEEIFREFGGDPVHLPREAWDASAEITWSEAFRRFFTPPRR